MANGNDISAEDCSQMSTEGRVRSNTWSVNSRQSMESDDVPPLPPVINGSRTVEADSSACSPNDKAANFRKNWTRRNAWGSLSYAELITKAIESSPEKRLTLSQIYDWIVQNVDYFANKSDNSSSAGWKNSIRHNLSLHSRFMRLVNDGAGKSSWWVINPDAQPFKTARRRTATMDSRTTRKKAELGRKRLDAGPRRFDEVDSTTPGSVYHQSKRNSPANVFQGEVGEAVVLRGSPHGYCENGRFRKMGPFTELLALDESECQEEAAKGPHYGLEVTDGFGKNHLESLRGEGRVLEQSISNGHRTHVTPDTNDNAASYMNGRQCAAKRRYIEDDQTLGRLGYCHGSAGFYDDGFDLQAGAAGNGCYRGSSGGGVAPRGGDFKRYFDKGTNCYDPGLGYDCRGAGNGYFSRCSPKHGSSYVGSYYGCYDNGGSFPDGYPVVEKSPDSEDRLNDRGSTDHHHHQHRSNGDGRTIVCETGGYDAKRSGVEDMDGHRGGSRRLEGNISAEDEANYQKPMEMGFQNRGSYGIEEGAHVKRVFDDYSGHDLTPECVSIGSHHDGSNSQTPVEYRQVSPTVRVGDNPVFFDGCNGYDFRTMSPGQRRHDELYYHGQKRGYLPPSVVATSVDFSSSRPFSQLLASRTAFPNCRSASLANDYFVSKAF